MNVDWPPLGPLPLDHAKHTFDLRELRGFAQTLCRVLVMLGVPDELVKVTAPGSQLRKEESKDQLSPQSSSQLALPYLPSQLSPS